VSPTHRSVPAPTTSCSRSAHAPLDFLNPANHSFDFLTRCALQQGTMHNEILNQRLGEAFVAHTGGAVLDDVWFCDKRVRCSLSL